MNANLLNFRFLFEVFADYCSGELARLAACCLACALARGRQLRIKGFVIGFYRGHLCRFSLFWADLFVLVRWFQNGVVKGVLVPWAELLQAFKNFLHFFSIISDIHNN
jgi:hypothetical protein